MRDDGQKGRFAYISMIRQARGSTRSKWLWRCTRLLFVASRPRLAHFISDPHQGRATCWHVRHPPTNPQLSYLAKGCSRVIFTNFPPASPPAIRVGQRWICKICISTSLLLLISSCPVASSIINETPTNLSSCHCHCAKPRMPDEKKADSMHVWFEKLT